MQIVDITESINQALQTVRNLKASFWLTNSDSTNISEAVILFGRTDGELESCHTRWSPKGNVGLVTLSSSCCPNRCPSDFSAAVKLIEEHLREWKPLMESLIVEQLTDPSTRPVNVSEELYGLVRLLISHVFQTEAPQYSPVASAEQFRQDQLKKWMLTLWSKGREGVQQWSKSLPVMEFSSYDPYDPRRVVLLNFKDCNARDLCLDNASLGRKVDFSGSDFSSASLKYALLRTGTFEKVSFVNANMEGANLSGITASGSDFTAANLRYSMLNSAILCNAVFKDADLTNSNLAEADLSGVDFTGANLRDSTLTSAILCNAVVSGADLTNSKLTRADLSGVDLTVCKSLKNTDFSGSCHDEYTRLPDSFSQQRSLLKWKGKGPDPYIEHIKKLANQVEVDFDGLIALLKEHIDNERLNKTVSMLKKERFQLFSEVNAHHLVGVVKSQTDKDLAYACRLSADGSFACCTQNLKACGGLRGALCKHLLVLVIGLSKTKELDPTLGARWALLSLLAKPRPDKTEMTNLFLKHKNIDVEIDWRSMETIPEDYYAL